MIEHLQNLSLHCGSVRLILEGNGVFVNDLHGVEAGRVVVEITCSSVAEAAEVDGADIAGTDSADEVKVTEGEARFAAESGGADSGVGEVRGAVRLDRETLR